MKATRSITVRLGAALVAAVLVSACGGDDDTSATTESSAAGSATSSTSEPGATVSVDVYLVDQEAFNVGTAPYVVALERQVPAEDPVTGALDALFAGPTTDEANEGIILVASGATGVGEVTLEDGVARVHLEGGCSSGGSTLSVADEIIPTLRQFEEVDVVKVYDPDGTTGDADGPHDSMPFCLEP
ncbi:MAG: GerMN domain-containing protein [Acidimicrobiia bacterium]|nr:GerMN domain-containing protein [Acidimicrobiia bacterium]